MYRRPLKFESLGRLYGVQQFCFRNRARAKRSDVGRLSRTIFGAISSCLGCVGDFVRLVHPAQLRQASRPLLPPCERGKRLRHPLDRSAGFRASLASNRQTGLLERFRGNRVFLGRSSFNDSNRAVGGPIPLRARAGLYLSASLSFHPTECAFTAAP